MQSRIHFTVLSAILSGFGLHTTVSPKNNKRRREGGRHWRPSSAKGGSRHPNKLKRAIRAEQARRREINASLRQHEKLPVGAKRIRSEMIGLRSKVDA